VGTSGGSGGTVGIGGAAGSTGGQTSTGGHVASGGDAGAGGAAQPDSGIVDGGRDASADTSIVDGGPCGGGPCTPIQVSAGSGIGAPKSLTVDPTAIYWTTGDFFGATQTGIFACPIAGCGANAPTTLAVDIGGPVSLAVAAGTFYFSDQKGGRIAQCPVTGCGTSAITCAAAQLSPTEMATDGKSIFWVDQGMVSPTRSGMDSALKKSSVTGAACGAVEALAPVPYLNNSLALDGQTLYIVVDASSLSTADGKILSCATGGCSQTPTEVAKGQLRPAWVTASGGVAYWTQGATFAQDGTCNPDGAIWTSNAGSSVGKVVVSNRVCPAFTRFDGSHIYWTQRKTPGFDASIHRALPDGTEVRTLVEHVFQVVDMRVTATALYWIGLDGVVWKLPK
jgi:hypothetical protein